ncbi:endonuclease-reverse transcriptase [Plakobranchus ocellatus]|uniref:Endonuclease-reverse transcriptase n=1 Tax=Plakobranchus ocellatus TaxID=259542 RepID=A0AAV4A773_9GAST|nr:endonuclease-reverse transcriptase [Plakobranchus ocellatus]
MLNIKLKDRIPTIEIRKKTQVINVVQYIQRQKWGWAGHIARKKDDRWTERHTERQPRSRRRDRGRPDRWMISGEQQVHNGRGRHKIGGNGRHLQKATSCRVWTKPPSNQETRDDQLVEDVFGSRTQRIHSLSLSKGFTQL